MKPNTQTQAAPYTKSVPVAHFKVLDEAQGIVEKFVSIFGNFDYAGDRVVYGAFANSLARRGPEKIKGVWMHDWARPTCKTLEIKEIAPGDAALPDAIKNNGGLYVKVQYALGTDDGRNAFEHLRFGTIDEFSFGYDIVKSAPAAGFPGKNDLLELDIWEHSDVLFGCNPLTALVSVKGKPAMKTKDLMAPGALADLKTKAQYLGEYVESDMTWAALRSLTDTLFWEVVYECLFWSDDPLDAKIEMLQGAFAEYGQFALAAIGALMGMAAGDSAAAEAQQTEFKAVFPAPDPNTVKTAVLPAGTAFKQQMDAALAAVNDCITRGEGLKALRAKDLRTPFGKERRAQITGLKDRLDGLLAELQPQADAAPGLSPEARQKFYERRIQAHEAAA